MSEEQKTDVKNTSGSYTANQLMKRIQSINLANSSNVVKLLNDLLYIDPNACRTLLQFKVHCNSNMLNHPHIQVSAQHEDSVVQVGIVGILNGVLSKLGIPRIRMIYMEDVLVGFDVNVDDIRVMKTEHENTITQASESEDIDNENDNKSKDSSEEFPVHGEERSGSEEDGFTNEGTRSESNGDSDSGKRSGHDDGEAFKATLQPEYQKVHAKEI